MMFRRVGAIALPVILALGACDGGGLEAAPSPPELIGDLIPVLYVDLAEIESREAALRDSEMQAQELIRLCMADQGFEYVPFVSAAGGPRGGAYTDAASQQEFVEQYGFGISAAILSPQEVPDASVGGSSDPNDLIFESLSPDEQHEYSLALNGELLQFDESMTEGRDDLLDPEKVSGCVASAYRESSVEEETALTDAFLDQFGDSLSGTLTQARLDPRMVEIEQVWTSCMKSSGYDFRQPDDARAFILRRLEEVGAVADLYVDSDGGVSYATNDIGQDEALQTAVANVAAEEVELAQLSAECEAIAGEQYRLVYEEYEAAFVQEYREDLERFGSEHEDDNS